MNIGRMKAKRKLTVNEVGPDHCSIRESPVVYKGVGAVQRVRHSYHVPDHRSSANVLQVISAELGATIPEFNELRIEFICLGVKCSEVILIGEVAFGFQASTSNCPVPEGCLLI